MNSVMTQLMAQTLTGVHLPIPAVRMVTLAEEHAVIRLPQY